MKARHAVAALLTASHLAGFALADENPKSTISLTVENDSFLGTDCYYTDGLRLQYMRPPNQLPHWTERVLKEIPPLGLDINRLRVGFALGQEMYTPLRLRPSALLVNDRPYGALLYGSMIARRGGILAGSVPAMDELEVQAGVVGPEAQGEETQKWWHRVWGNIQPNGWKNQLKTEPALQLYATRSIQFGWRSENYWGFDVVPHGKVALGNVYDYAETGILLRGGYNLPSEYIVSPQESYVTHPSSNSPKFAAYVFAGADGRAVGRNLFLDGNTFTSSHSVSKESFVADLRLGGAFRWRSFETVLSLVHRTREFKLQPKEENFMSVTLQYHF